jgi:hypothetical protein
MRVLVAEKEDIDGGSLQAFALEDFLEYASAVRATQKHVHPRAILAKNAAHSVLSTSPSINSQTLLVVPENCRY